MFAGRTWHGSRTGPGANPLFFQSVRGSDSLRSTSECDLHHTPACGWHQGTPLSPRLKAGPSALNSAHRRRSIAACLSLCGGGARPDVIDRQPDDAYHYCLLRVFHRELNFEMKRLEMVDGKAQWTTGDAFTLSAPKKRRPLRDAF